MIGCEALGDSLGTWDLNEETPEAPDPWFSILTEDPWREKG